MHDKKPISITLHVGGMTCEHCAGRVEKALLALPGVHRAAVSYSRERAEVRCDTDVSPGVLERAVCAAGYAVIPADAHRRERWRLWALCAAAVAGYFLFRRSGLMNLFPEAQAGMGLGALFAVGLLTSVHCVGMCGGINLSQSLSAGQADNSRRQILWGTLKYNLGRIASYTLIGGVIGAIGSVFSLSNRTQGAIQLVAGVFMLMMGANMMGLIPGLRRLRLTLPPVFGKLQAKLGGCGPVAVGLLNGLMPCGPLQAMQLYALSTGSASGGALSLMVFGLGTLPLMIGLGALSSVVGKRQLRELVRVGAALILVMGVGVLGNGLALSGFSLSFASQPPMLAAETASGVQTLTTELLPRRYTPITVQAGVPVSWTIHAEQTSLNNCNNRMIIPEYGVEAQLKAGDNLVNFTPLTTGTFTYTCWMGMIRSTITVTDGPVDEQAQTGGPVIDVAIPVGDIAVAEVADGIQTVSISVGTEGFSPAVVVMQSGLETHWEIVNEGADTAGLVFPVYGARLILVEDSNTIALVPYFDFDFGSVEKHFFGYVKVVDSLDDLDMDAIRTEVEAYRPEAIDYP